MSIRLRILYGFGAVMVLVANIGSLSAILI